MKKVFKILVLSIVFLLTTTSCNPESINWNHNDGKTATDTSKKDANPPTDDDPND